MNFDFWKNKNVVITGGTSGLGRALALKLEGAGANVLIVARTEKNIADMIQTRPRIIGISADVSKKAEIYPLAGQIHSSLGHVDFLFNVASDLGATPLLLLADTDCEDFEKVLQTNLLGVFRLTKALLPSMLLKHQGVVLNISSDAAINAYPRWGSYGVSKAALDHLSRIFDAELKDQGVRFLAIDPGDMNTPMHFAAVPNADPSKLRDPNESAERILNLISEENFLEVRRSV